VRLDLNNRYVKILAGFGLGLALLDLAFASSGGWGRLVWTVIAYGFLLLVYRISQLSLDDAGLARQKILSGIKYGGLLAGAILSGFLIVYLLHKSTFRDPRYHQSLSLAFYAALILLPLKTVLFEELAFRGLFPALSLKIKHSRMFATAISSAAYGAWHLVHLQGSGNAVIAGNVSAPRFLVLFLTFIATTFAGIIFCELRWRSGSLAASIIVHWSINACAIIFASLSWS
jgi:membrane protease YdiL (CAAX protease family)